MGLAPEQRVGALGNAHPGERGLRLFDQRSGLRQVDLLDVFGTASVVSEVLNGKRELSKNHILKLSERFHLSPALFF